MLLHIIKYSTIIGSLLSIIFAQELIITSPKNNDPIKDEIEIQWNGTNEYGQQVSAGMYFYHLQTAKFSKVRKMVLLK